MHLNKIETIFVLFSIVGSLSCMIDKIVLSAGNIWPCNPVKVPTKPSSNEPKLGLKNGETYNGEKHPSSGPKIAHNF